MDESLRRRLAAAGVNADRVVTDPAAAYAALYACEGDDATLEDRFAIEAAALGTEVDGLSGVDRRKAMEDFYGHRWDGFEIVGTEDRNDEIEVVEYDPTWGQVFAEWRDRIARELGEVAVRIDHVGSTAVPGLPAKPIVDIQVSVTDVSAEDTYVPGLAVAGVSLRSRDAEHRYFRPPPGRPRDVHVHVCRIGGRWERDHLLFRDHLLVHDQVRREYAALKRDLASRFVDDRLAYTEGKSIFIRSVMEEAEHWERER